MRRRHKLTEKGYTLVEMLVVTALIGFITTFLIINFSRTRINFKEETNTLIAKIRLAQTKTTSSTRFNDSIRCGYGIKYIDNQSYLVYAAENASVFDCAIQNKDYNPIPGNSDYDGVVEVVNFSDERLEFKTSFRAIYFEPPDPKTYIIDAGGTVHQEANYNLNIIIGKVGGTCPQDCRTVDVFTSGRIE